MDTIVIIEDEDCTPCGAYCCEGITDLETVENKIREKTKDPDFSLEDVPLTIQVESAKNLQALQSFAEDFEVIKI